MGISPWNIGDENPVWTFSLETDSGNFDTTGLITSDFSLVMINISNRQVTNGTGTFSNIMPVNGANPATINYQLSAADALITGMQDMRIVVKKGTAQQETFKFGIWENLQ